MTLATTPCLFESEWDSVGASNRTCANETFQISTRSSARDFIRVPAEAGWRLDIKVRPEDLQVSTGDINFPADERGSQQAKATRETYKLLSASNSSHVNNPRGTFCTFSTRTVKWLVYDVHYRHTKIVRFSNYCSYSNIFNDFSTRIRSKLRSIKISKLFFHPHVNFKYTRQ